MTIKTSNEGRHEKYDPRTNTQQNGLFIYQIRFASQLWDSSFEPTREKGLTPLQQSPSLGQNRRAGGWARQ